MLEDCWLLDWDGWVPRRRCPRLAGRPVPRVKPGMLTGDSGLRLCFRSVVKVLERVSLAQYVDRLMIEESLAVELCAPIYPSRVL